MAATISQVRAAIATAVSTISGLRASDKIVEQVSPPQAVVFRKPWTYDPTMHSDAAFGAVTYQFGVRVYGARVSERSAQILLDEYAEPAGAKSVKQAIESNPALQALIDDVVVTEVGQIEVVGIEQVEYLVEEFTIEVFVS